MASGTGVLYTLDEANRILPLVRSIVRDIVDEFRLLRSAGRTRRALEVESTGQARTEARLHALATEVAEHSARIEGYLQELAYFGVEVRDLELGLVDFPALVDGEPAYLSWGLGEDAVAWWHPADKAFGDRKPLRAPVRLPAGPAHASED